MIKLRHLLSLLVCAVVFLGANDAAEEAGSDEGSKSEDVCYQPELSQYGDLFREAFAVSLGEDVQVYINCMSFGENGELETAVVSGRNESGNETGVFTFKCGGSALIAFESERTFSKMETESCLECDTSSTTGDACVTPCTNDCERCYGAPGKCDCTRYLVYGTEEVTRALRRLNSRDLGEEDEEIERVLEETIIGESECENECEDEFKTSDHGNGHICYACGIQFCIECEKAEDDSGHDECTECLPHTVLYHEEGECLYGLRAEILEVVEEQEREVEEEERLRDIARIELAVSLPIACVLTVTFFLIMSFIAHKRYPHIGETGQTRHRNKPSESAEEELPIPDSVFQPRPTVRLR